MLFDPLLKEINEQDTEVIPLPSTGAQDYISLANFVARKIADRECVLLAESYSGGIAEALLRNHDLKIKHVIFVASFLSSPSRFLSRVAAVLPIKALAAIPVIAPLVLKAFLLGRSASAESIALFRRSLMSVDSRTLRERLRQIAAYQASGVELEAIATYIRPKSDFLVGDRSSEFRKTFPQLEIVEVEGPHFLLQAKPAECAKAILASVSHLTTTSKETLLPQASRVKQ